MSDDSTSVNPADGVWMVYEWVDQEDQMYPVAVFRHAEEAVRFAMPDRARVTFWPYGVGIELL